MTWNIAEEIGIMILRLAFKQIIVEAASARTFDYAHAKTIPSAALRTGAHKCAHTKNKKTIKHQILPAGLHWQEQAT